MAEKKTYEELKERIRELELQMKESGNREYKGPSVTGDAIDKAIDEMPEDFLIKKFITASRAEVKDMCLTEYNETETMEMMKEEGRQETMVLNIKNLMDSTGWTAEKAMDTLKIPQAQRTALYVDLSRKT